MSAILALVTALILIAVAIVWKRKPAVDQSPVLVRRYVHPGHTWVRLTDDGYAIVGVDEFAEALIGTIEEVEMPRLLRRVRQGEIACHVWHGDRVVPLVSPIDGRVVEKNEMVLKNPTLINTSPLGDGWIFKVRVANAKRQLSNLLTGRSAQQWQDAARMQLSRFFNGTPALMYQDGGVLISNIAERCSEEEWKSVAKQFLQLGDADLEKCAARRRPVRK